MITGGNSYPVIVIMQDSADVGVYDVSTLMVAGQYPLYNLSIRAKFKEETILDTVAHEVRQITPYSINKKIEADAGDQLIIRLSAKNGNWNQIVSFHFDENTQKHYFTSRLSSLNDREVLHDIDSRNGGFPIGNLSDLSSYRYK